VYEDYAVDEATIFKRGEGDRLKRVVVRTSAIDAGDAMAPPAMRALLTHLASRAQPPIERSSNTNPESLTETPDPVAAPQQESESSSVDGLKTIHSVRTDVNPDGLVPDDFAEQKFQEQAAVYHGPGTNRDWSMYQYWWEAPALCHSPLYYEEINVERYGYSHGLGQPAFSAAHFFGSTVALPYLLAATPPGECVYTLGHYRPGSYVPYQLHRPPFSLKGGISQAAVVTGLILLIP
jgi:hypothetical protein